MLLSKWFSQSTCSVNKMTKDAKLKLCKRKIAQKTNDMTRHFKWIHLQLFLCRLIFKQALRLLLHEWEWDDVMKVCWWEGAVHYLCLNGSSLTPTHPNKMECILTHHRAEIMTLSNKGDDDFPCKRVSTFKHFLLVCQKKRKSYPHFNY